MQVSFLMPARFAAALRSRPLLVDALFAVATIAIAIAAALGGNVEYRPPSATLGVVAAVLAGLVIGIRRLAPIPTLLAATAAEMGCLLSGWSTPPLIIAVGAAAYTATSRAADRRVAWVVAASCAVLLYLAGVAGLGLGWLNPMSLSLLPWTGMAAAIGDAARSRRAYITAVEQRALRAEQTREEEAQRRVIQERLRIARELHDVVAHHIAVINMQAGGATRVLERHPDQARAALGHIGQACDTVLRELGAIVGVLRQSDDPEAGTEPTRGLARMPELLEAVAATGYRVDYRRSGEPRDLPAVVDLAAYRIVQEALTNAHKYGTGPTGLTVAYTADGLTIDVVNTVAAGHHASGSGYGIVGMRERATAADGTLQACVGPDGRFTVHARLPAP